MRIIAFIFLIGLLSPVAAFAQGEREGYVELPGNAYYRAGQGSGNIYIHRNNSDDYIYRALVPGARNRNNIQHFPSNDFSAICGNVTRNAELRRCRDDVMDQNKDRQKLFDKYNN